MNFENISSFNPADCIAGKMMRLQRVTANIFRKHLHPFGVTNSQITLLFILSKRDDLNQKQLAGHAVLEKSSLNRNLKRLFEAELISKKQFPIIKITRKGKTLVNDIIPEWKNAMQEIQDLLGSEGRSGLDAVTHKLLNQKS